jgi:hypothetical protein
MVKKIQPLTAVTILLALFFSGKAGLCAQTHISVPVDHAVYYLLDQAEARGLCSPLPAVKPYTRAKILEVVDEILAAEPKRFGSLTDGEREILENARMEFSGVAAGFNPQKGMYRFDTTGKKDVRFSADVGIAMESISSAARYTEQEETYVGTDTWGTLFIRGDVGEHFSFDVDFSAGMMKAQRVELGEYDTYATGLIEDDDHKNKRVSAYSQPLAFFPYTYQRNWDGFMFNLGGPITAGNMEYWPNSISIAAKMESEMSASVFGDMLLLRFGRIQREWGAMSPGSSLVLNGAARPFTGIEANFNPVPWFAYSFITGVLEYDNNSVNNDDDPAKTFQNAYSLQQVEINYKNYFHIDFGSSALWPKRFELGYAFPLLDNFFYQNYIGDFDNMAVFFNIKGQYPGLGKVWFSFFMDEMEISSMGSAFDLDRHMFAYQAGVQGIIPFLPFTSLAVSYTKVEPYNYTHTKVVTPWYDRPMETAYINGGACLGYYLPPNSDEIKARFETRPLAKTAAHLQYQLIRHGADFGRHQVDGSSLVSELDPKGRGGEKASLKKSFLKDGAYQWTHIIKIGAEHTLKNFPITFFGEAGMVYSYFTDISENEYVKYHPAPTDGRNDDGLPAGVYSKSTAFILTLGFKIFK